MPRIKTDTDNPIRIGWTSDDFYWDPSYDREGEILFLASPEHKAIRSFLHYLDCSPFEYGVHTQWSSLDTPVSLTLYIPFSLMSKSEIETEVVTINGIQVENEISDFSYLLYRTEIAPPERTEDFFPEDIYNKMLDTDLVGSINRQMGCKSLLGCKFTVNPKGNGGGCVSLMAYCDALLEDTYITREDLASVPELYSRGMGDSYALYKMYRSHDREHSMTGFHTVYRGTTSVNGKCPPIDMHGLVHPILRAKEVIYPFLIRRTYYYDSDEFYVYPYRLAQGFLSVCVSLYPYIKGAQHPSNYKRFNNLLLKNLAWDEREFYIYCTTQAVYLGIDPYSWDHSIT